MSYWTWVLKMSRLVPQTRVNHVHQYSYLAGGSHVVKRRRYQRPAKEKRPLNLRLGYILSSLKWLQLSKRHSFQGTTIPSDVIGTIPSSKHGTSSSKSLVKHNPNDNEPKLYAHCRVRMRLIVVTNSLHTFPPTWMGKTPSMRRKCHCTRLLMKIRRNYIIIVAISCVARWRRT